MHAFDVGHGTKDGVECANAQRIVVGNSQSVVTRQISFQNHVAAFLIDAAVTVMFAEELDQLRAAQIARQFPAPARSSSRTRCSRTAAGLGWSKK